MRALIGVDFYDENYRVARRDYPAAHCVKQFTNGTTSRAVIAVRIAGIAIADAYIEAEKADDVQEEMDMLVDLVRARFGDAP